ncbi:TIGR03790 family protein [bacterium]|nr:TIGR03790 family protein [bacterium]
MLRWVRWLWFLGFPFLLLGEVNPATTIVIANQNNPEGVQIAQILLRKRNIPEENLIILPLSTEEEISWSQYSETILNPLRHLLLSRQLIAGEIKAERDEYGREGFIKTENPRVTWIICMTGVPLKIKNLDHDKYPENAPLKRSQACVDSELALLGITNHNPHGPINNPWFGNASLVTSDVIRTARLDGPSSSDILRSLNQTWQAEKNGLRGRSYIDKGGPYPEGDVWLDRTANLSRSMGFPTDIEETPKLFHEKSRSDAPAFYFGWYTQLPQGRFGLQRVLLAPGSIAIHTHSFSAFTLRSSSGNWAAWLVKQGAGLTAGNVYEPYLQFSLRPDALMRGIAQGMTAGEAAWFATPAISWQGTILGDPFYRPLAHDIQPQLKDFLVQPDDYSVYSVLRGAEIEQKINPQKSLAMLVVAQEKNPSILLAYAIAKSQQQLNLPLTWPEDSDLPDLGRADDGLIFEIGQFLLQNGQKKAGLRVLKALNTREGWKDSAELKQLILDNAV